MMIRDRLIFLIICSILSTLATSTRATELNLSRRDNFFEPATISPESEVEPDLTSSWKQNWLAQSDRALEQNNNSTSPIEKSPAIDKRWSLVGIAITSAVSLVLLRLLFTSSEGKKNALTAVDGEGKAIDKRQSDRLSKEKPIEADSLVDLEVILNSNDSQATALLSDEERYPLDNEVSVANSELTSRLTILNSNTTEPEGVLRPIEHLQHRDRDLRREAIWGLAQIGDSRGIEPLVKILPQLNLTDRSLGLKAIANITERSFKPINDHLFSTLDNPNPEIKKNAIRDITTLYEFVAPLTKQLALMQLDRDIQVQQTAKLAIKRLNLCYFPCLYDDCPASANYSPDSQDNDKQERSR